MKLPLVLLLVGTIQLAEVGDTRCQQRAGDGDATRDRHPATPDSRSLDQQLLDELRSDLLEGLDDFPSRRVLETNRDQVKPAIKPADEPDETDIQLLDQWGDGEDIELGKPSDPLFRIGKKMRTAQQLIDRGRTMATTQRLQQGILEDLAALIQRQRKRNTGGKSDASTAVNQKPNTAPDAQVGSDPTGDPSGPQQSTFRIGSSNADRTEFQLQNHFFDEVWGQLPGRFLQQMRSASFERFLPKYEKLIEDYYQRLAENPMHRP